MPAVLGIKGAWYLMLSFALVFETFALLNYTHNLIIRAMMRK